MHERKGTMNAESGIANESERKNEEEKNTLLCTY